MNSKIKNYSRLALATSVILPLSCKKDKVIDDPNVLSKNINLTLSDLNPLRVREETKNNGVLIDYHEIDVNNDGQGDIFVLLAYNATGGNKELYSYFENTPSSRTYFSSYGTDPLLKPMERDTEMNGSIPTYEYGYFNIYERTGSTVNYNIQNIFNGKGDKYVGFHFQISGKKHYGWVRVNLSADGKTLVIKDAAYDIRPNTPIRIGVI